MKTWSNQPSQRQWKAGDSTATARTNSLYILKNNHFLLVDNNNNNLSRHMRLGMCKLIEVNRNVARLFFLFFLLFLECSVERKRGFFFFLFCCFIGILFFFFCLRDTMNSSLSECMNVRYEL
jgi:uncharacterized membrane protein